MVWYFNMSFYKYTIILSLTIILLIVGLFVICPDAFASSVNIQQSLCAGANLDYTAINNPGACGNAQMEASGLQVNTLVTSVISILSWGIGVVAVFMIIIGGFKYITSGGDTNGVSAAKNTIIYAIIGLVIVALAQVAVKFILGRLNAVGVT